MKMLVICGACLVSAALCLAQEQVYRVTVDVPLVWVDVDVFDPAGKAVMNLSKEDFFVFDNGAPQEIRDFMKVDAPYSVLLLLDRNRVTRSPALQSAVNAFFSTMSRQTRFAAAIFDQSAEWLSEWRDVGTNVVQNIRIPVPTVEPLRVQSSDNRYSTYFRPQETNSRLYPALKWTVAETAKTPGRKGVVVFTDFAALAYQDLPKRRTTVAGDSRVVPVDPIDDSEFKVILKALGKSDARFYFVVVGNGSEAAFFNFDVWAGAYSALQYRTRFELLAESSGGRTAFARSMEDITPLYEQIARDLSVSYGIGYKPPRSAPNQRHRIEIRMRNNTYTVRASKDGYSAP